MIIKRGYSGIYCQLDKGFKAFFERRYYSLMAWQRSDTAFNIPKNNDEVIIPKEWT